MSTRSADKRRSFHVLGPIDNSRSSRQLQPQQQHQQHQRGHQRSKSAITSDMLPNQNGNRRNTNFGLHTLAEEEDAYNRRKQQHHQYQQQQQDEQSITVDSLQNMINTLKTLPSQHDQQQQQQQQSSSVTPTATTSNSRRNSHRKHQSLNFGLPQGARRLSYNGSSSASSGRNSSNGGIDIQSVLPIPSTEEKADRRRSSMRMRAGSISEHQDEDDNASNFGLSREQALAEAEAKLMGTYKKPTSQDINIVVNGSDSTPSNRRSNNNRNSTPITRRYSESSGTGNNTSGFDLNVTASTSTSKRVSLQLPTLNENTLEGGPSARANRRITFNKPLNLGNDTNKAMGHNRRSSRNFTDDWRNSKLSFGGRKKEK